MLKREARSTMRFPGSRRDRSALLPTPSKLTRKQSRWPRSYLMTPSFWTFRRQRLMVTKAPVKSRGRPFSAAIGCRHAQFAALTAEPAHSFAITEKASLHMLPLSAMDLAAVVLPKIGRSGTDLRSDSPQ